MARCVGVSARTIRKTPSVAPGSFGTRDWTTQAQYGVHRRGASFQSAITGGYSTPYHSRFAKTPLPLSVVCQNFSDARLLLGSAIHVPWATVQSLHCFEFNVQSIPQQQSTYLSLPREYTIRFVRLRLSRRNVDKVVYKVGAGIRNKGRVKMTTLVSRKVTSKG